MDSQQYQEYDEGYHGIWKWEEQGERIRGSQRINTPSGELVDMTP